MSFGGNYNQAEKTIVKGKTMPVSVSASDVSGVQQIEIYQGIDGSLSEKLLQKCVSNSKYTEDWCAYFFSTDNFPINTVLTFWARVVDGAGNVNWAGTYKITVKSDDTSAPEIVFSGRYSDTQLNLNVYAVDKNQQNPIVKIEVYQQGSSGGPMFVWNDSTATAKDVWKHFQNDNFAAAGTSGFVAKAYDKVGNVGMSETLILPVNMDHLRVVNPSLSWIYYNILMKNTSVQKNGLKKFFVFTGNTYNKNKMQAVATCTTLSQDNNNFTCSYFQPWNLKASGFGYILAVNNKNKFSSFPVMPFSW
jgi:hypothetical protein